MPIILALIIALSFTTASRLAKVEQKEVGNIPGISG
jgi:hypothetical protein